MPVKTWVMLESHDFLADGRIYMPLNLEGASSGGTLRIKATLLSSPAPPVLIEEKEEVIVIPKEILLESPDLLLKPIEGVTETTITVPGGTTEPITAVIDPIWVEEIVTPEPEIIPETTIVVDVPSEPEPEPIIDPKVVIEERITEPIITSIAEPITTTISRSTTVEPTKTTTSTREPSFGGGLLNFFFGSKSFIAPPSAPLSTINIWMGGGATLVYSSRHSKSFDIAVPVNFFQDVPLVESMYESAPITIGGSTIPASTFGRIFGNPLELGDFGDMFMIDEGPISAPTYPTITASSPVISTPMLRGGYHACFLEVVTNGNTWRIHVEIEYDYERTGEALTSEEAPIVRNILVNKTMSGLARIGWQTDVKSDRNWITYGIGDNPTTPINLNTIEATTGTLTPYALMTMQDGTFYVIQVFSELKGRTTNSEPFVWKMPDESIRKTVDLTIQGNSAGDGLIGDGIVVTIESKQELTRGRPQLPILPMLVVGGVALVGLGGAAWIMLQRKKT